MRAGSARRHASTATGAAALAGTLLAVGAAGAAGTAGAAGAAGAGAAAKRPFTLTSTAFAENAPIPTAFSCNGTGTRPPLAWKGAPAGTRALAIAVIDPDAPTAGGFTHWLAWNIAPGKGGAGSLGSAAAVPRQGASSVGSPLWIAPCPPSGVHRYIFTLTALRAPLALAAGADRTAFEKAVAAAKPLGSARLIGRYGTGPIRKAMPMNAEEPPPDEE